MKFSVTSKDLATSRHQCVVVPVGQDGKTLPAGLPAETRSAIRSLVKSGDFAGKKGQQDILRPAPGLASHRLLLLGTGADKSVAARDWLKLVSAAAKAVAATGADNAALVCDETMVSDVDRAWLVRETTRTVAEALYRFDEFRSKPGKQPALKKWQLQFAASDRSDRKSLRQGEAIAAGVALARDLGNEPPNVCFPDALARRARDMAKTYEKLKVTVLTEKQAERLGMGAFCAVSRGSEHEGRLIAFEYQGGKGKPLALVGKGITFDTGGISLKPGASMDEMKYDMCGAASVFGTVKAICEMDLPLNVVAVVAAAENMPDGRAARPGDIVTSLSGQTIEILNTDAEGRLVLCDALTWTQNKFKPSSIVDIATLTGACVVALGSHAQAVYSNDDSLRDALLSAGEATGDRGWPMPLWDDYQEQLDSPFADMANIGGPKGGSITAACFLSRFTHDVPWAHLDIAGTAWISGGKQKGATGRPVPMLTRYLMDQAGI